MDPVSMILDALKAGGVAAGLGAAATTSGLAAKDAYNALMSRLRERLKGRPGGELILDRHAQAPDIWERPLGKELVESGAAEDTEIIQAAEAILSIVSTQQTAVGKYNVQAGRDISTVVQGDHVHVNLPEAGIQDLFMDLPTFEQRVKSALTTEGWEVKLPREGKLFALQQDGWEEVFVPDGRGHSKRVVVGEHGRAELIPVKRRRLSDGAQRLLVASVGITTGRFAHAMVFHKQPPMLRIGGVVIQDVEARYVLQELLDSGLIEYDSGDIYRLTPKGRKRAGDLSAGAA